MSDFLAAIVEETRRAIEDPTYAVGVPTAAARRPASLCGAIRSARRGALIVEHKRVSPGSSEPRLPARSMDEFARFGEAGGADGFSCLAARPRFEGSPRDVADLCARTVRPVLFKEFVIDPVQISVAERSGASAVLLIARLARPAYGVAIRELAEEAHRHRLEVLLEFHERAELSLAEGVPADMYGVNTRDLSSLRIDRDTAETTIRAASDHRPLLGLSGVDGPAEARRLWELGVDGLLVGSGFARAADPVRFLDSLRTEGGGRS
jgi:indole-3-glycerol phosphate synthase